MNEVPETVLPGEYSAAVEAGVREAALHGVFAGHELTDVKATLIGGSYHAHVANSMVFQVAGSMAFQEAAKKVQRYCLNRG